MTLEDMLRALHVPSGDAFSDYAASQGIEFRLPEIPAQDAGEPPRIELGVCLRNVLDLTEASVEGVITCRDIICWGWRPIREILAGWAWSSDQPATAQVMQWEWKAMKQFLDSNTTDDERKPLGGMLGHFGRDWTDQENPLPIIGRDAEIDALISILIKVFKPNAILVGDAGVGKTAVVEGLAARIKAGNVPKPLSGKRLVEIAPSTILAGTSMHGEFEKRITGILQQAEEDPDIILFIDEIHTLMGRDGSSTARSMPDILKPALARGRLRMIGATTRREYQATIARDSAFERRFHPLHIGEPDLATVREILSRTAPHVASHHGLAIPEEILDLVVELARREMPFRRFPDKALDVLDRACAAAAIAGDAELRASHTREVVASLAGMKFTSDSLEFQQRLAELEDRLNERVIGQKAAVEATCNVVRLCKRRLDLRPERPDGVFLFVGPSGVGQTELARSLHQLVTGTEGEPIRLDMTSFTQSHSVSQIIGSPPGYVGYEVEPAWLGELSKCPSGVLLLDEFEKAHPDVQRIFLRAFDEGRIEDARGDLHSLSNITVIATSNAVPSSSSGAMGFHNDAIDDLPSVAARLGNLFPTELLNRFDEIVEFVPLEDSALIRILRNHILARSSEIFRRECRTDLTLTEEACRHLIRIADPARFGARELQRVFEREILNPAVKHHAKKSIPPESILVTSNDCEFRFE